MENPSHIEELIMDHCDHSSLQMKLRVQSRNDERDEYYVAFQRHTIYVKLFCYHIFTQYNISKALIDILIHDRSGSETPHSAMGMAFEFLAHMLGHQGHVL